MHADIYSRVPSDHQNNRPGGSSLLHPCTLQRRITVFLFRRPARRGRVKWRSSSFLLSCSASYFATKHLSLKMASVPRSILGAARLSAAACGRCAPAVALQARTVVQCIAQARGIASSASRWAEVAPGQPVTQTNREPIVPLVS